MSCLQVSLGQQKERTPPHLKKCLLLLETPPSKDLCLDLHRDSDYDVSISLCLWPWVQCSNWECSRAGKDLGSIPSLYRPRDRLPKKLRLSHVPQLWQTQHLHPNLLFWLFLNGISVTKKSVSVRLRPSMPVGAGWHFLETFHEHRCGGNHTGVCTHEQTDTYTAFWSQPWRRNLSRRCLRESDSCATNVEHGIAAMSLEFLPNLVISQIKGSLLTPFIG